jgi:ribosome-binding protein aMBF1 (putative translation factor)
VPARYASEIVGPRLRLGLSQQQLAQEIGAASKAVVYQMTDTLAQELDELKRTLDTINRREWQAEQAKNELVEANLRLLSPSRRSTGTEDCSSST